MADFFSFPFPLPKTLEPDFEGFVLGLYAGSPMIGMETFFA